MEGAAAAAPDVQLTDELLNEMGYVCTPSDVFILALHWIWLRSCVTAAGCRGIPDAHGARVLGPSKKKAQTARLTPNIVVPYYPALFFLFIFLCFARCLLGYVLDSLSRRLSPDLQVKPQQPSAPPLSKSERKKLQKIEARAPS